MKIRIMAKPQDNELFSAIIRKLQRINVVKIINQSIPYKNRGLSIEERIYFEIEINPEILQTKFVEIEQGRISNYEKH